MGWSVNVPCVELAYSRPTDLAPLVGVLLDETDDGITPSEAEAVDGVRLVSD